MDIRTTKEKERDKEHAEIRDFYRALSRQNPTSKPWRICRAVSEIANGRNMRNGKGYTPEAVRIICQRGA